MRKYIEKRGSLLIVGILVLLSMYSLLTSLEKKKVKTPINPLQEEATKTKLQRLEDDKKALQIKILEQETKSKDLLEVVDSLENLKPKIKVKYVTKYKDIDSAGSMLLAKEFDSIFSSHNIK